MGDRSPDIMNVGITGATGFIGSHLVNYFAAYKEVKLICLTRRMQPWMSGVIGGVTWLQGELESTDDCSTFVSRCEVIIHLAQSNNPVSSNKNWMQDAQANLLPTLNLLQSIKDSRQVKHFLYSSSGGVLYGKTINYQPWKEKDLCVPETPYALQKLIIENYIRIATEQGWLRASILRIGNPYGHLLPPERKHGLIGITLQRLITDLPIQLYGADDIVRDYLHLDDLARAFNLALVSKANFEIFNVGSGVGTSVRGVLDMIEQVTGCTLKREVINYGIQEMRATPWSVLDCTLIRNFWNWKPEIGLEDGITSLWNNILASKEYTQ
jgi:UDP-glucose 4-epimerase